MTSKSTGSRQQIRVMWFELNAQKPSKFGSGHPAAEIISGF
jgi:hypothetical protein